MHQHLKIAVCDDTKSDLEHLLEVLRQCSIPSDCDVFESGEEFLTNYKSQYYDLLLTDIYMDNMNGIEMVTKLREIDTEIPVAFVTTSTDFALESYRLSALKYIEKPFKKNDLEEMLELALMKKNNVPSLILQKNRQDEKIPFNRITYLEQQGHHLFIHVYNNESVDICEKLSEVIPHFPETGYFSPHKSYLVNLDYVKYVDTDLKCFVMNDDSNIPIRRESIGSAKKALADHLFQKARRDF